jgi:hypothetical protein
VKTLKILQNKGSQNKGGVKPEVQQKLLNVDLLGGQLTEFGATEQIDEDFHRGLVVEQAKWVQTPLFHTFSGNQPSAKTSLKL